MEQSSGKILINATQTNSDGLSVLENTNGQLKINSSLFNKNSEDPNKLKVLLLDKFDEKSCDHAADYNSDGEVLKNTENIDLEIGNSSYSCFKFYSFMIIYCLSGLYMGSQMAFTMNLAKPIIKMSLGITNPIEIDHWQGIMNLGFGLGKLFGSVLAGALAKLIGKHTLIYISEIFNVSSIVLVCFSNSSFLVISRVLCGLTSGFNATMCSRQVIECYPKNYRGVPPVFYSVCISIGYFISIGAGKIFTEKGQEKYWFQILLGLCLIQFVRSIISLIWMNHDSPIYYTIKAYEAKTAEKRLKLLEKRDEVLKSFYKYTNELESEKKDLESLTQTQIKLTEKSFKDLIYKNCISREGRYSFFAVTAFMFWNPISGQVYLDSYVSRIFDKFVYDGFGFQVTFYSGILAVVGTICLLYFIEKFDRIPIQVTSQLITIICMWLLSLCFYFEMINTAFAVSLIFTLTYWFGNSGVHQVYLNEIAEPFVVGIGFGVNWAMKCIMGLFLPWLFDNVALYWTPLLMTALGLVFYIIFRPLYLETRNKTYTQISEEYADFKYKISKILE